MDNAEIINDIRSDRIKKIIVDCDAGADGDDQFALAWALCSPDKVEVLSANSAPFNENSDETAEAGRRECEEIIKCAGLDIPAYCGSSDYITRRGEPFYSDAARNVRDAAMRYDEPVYVVITGCCTNVACALALYPEIRNKIVVVWLALDNLDGRSNTGEYNYHNDIVAGKLLFSLAENLVLVCAGRVVAPFRKSDDEIDALFSSDRPLPSWLRKRFREIPWAQGLWDLCAEGLLIVPGACETEICDRPVFGEDGEIEGFDNSRKMVVVNKNDHDMILADCVRRINGWSVGK